MVGRESVGVDWKDVHPSTQLTDSVSEGLLSWWSLVTHSDTCSRAGFQGGAMEREQEKSRPRRLLVVMLVMVEEVVVLEMENLKQPGCPSVNNDDAWSTGFQPCISNLDIKLTSTPISFYRIGSCSWIG